MAKYAMILFFISVVGIYCNLISEGRFFTTNEDTKDQFSIADDFHRSLIANADFHLCGMQQPCLQVKIKKDAKTSIVWNSIERTAPRFHDCNSFFEWGKRESGIYEIWPKTLIERKLSVHCNMGDKVGGWITIQRRVDDEAYFNRDWSDYKRGFGNLTQSFWIGLENLNVLAGPGKGAKLRINIDNGDNRTFAEYKKFEINDESNGYRMQISGYSGNASNGMKMQNGMKFSTPDRDNDNCACPCAANFSGGWWFGNCMTRPHTNLNGMYGVGKTDQWKSGILWGWKENRIKRVEMKIKY